METEISAVEVLSKTKAAEDFLMLKPEQNPVQAFNEALGSEQEVELIEHKESIARVLSRHGDLIKSGATVLAIDGTLPGDVNEWDVEQLATIGLNTENKKQIESELASFDMAKCAWITETGEEYDFSRTTGLPKF